MSFGCCDLLHDALYSNLQTGTVSANTPAADGGWQRRKHGGKSEEREQRKCIPSFNLVDTVVLSVLQVRALMRWPRGCWICWVTLPSSKWARYWRKGNISIV